VVVAVADKVIY